MASSRSRRTYPAWVGVVLAFYAFIASVGSLGATMIPNAVGWIADRAGLESKRWWLHPKWRI